MADQLDFQYLNDFFLSIGAVSSPSKLHGVLCGRLCGGQKLSAEQWCKDVLPILSLEYLPPAEEQMEELVLFLRQTQTSLADEQLQFSLLLPEDEVGVKTRTEELAYWCEGFIEGLAASGLTNTYLKGSEEVEETLKNIAQISQLDSEFGEESSEEKERSLYELQEFVKVAVLDLYLGKEKPPTSGSDSKMIH